MARAEVSPDVHDSASPPTRPVHMSFEPTRHTAALRRTCLLPACLRASADRMGSIRFPIEFGKGFAGIGIALENGGPRYTDCPCQTPGNKYGLTFGAKMWQVSSPEHKEPPTRSPA